MTDVVCGRRDELMEEIEIGNCNSCQCSLLRGAVGYQDRKRETPAPSFQPSRLAVSRILQLRFATLRVASAAEVEPTRPALRREAGVVHNPNHGWGAAW